MELSLSLWKLGFGVYDGMPTVCCSTRTLRSDADKLWNVTKVRSVSWADLAITYEHEIIFKNCTSNSTRHHSVNFCIQWLALVFSRPLFTCIIFQTNLFWYILLAIYTASKCPHFLSIYKLIYKLASRLDSLGMEISSERSWKKKQHRRENCGQILTNKYYLLQWYVGFNIFK